MNDSACLTWKEGSSDGMNTVLGRTKSNFVRENKDIQFTMSRRREMSDILRNRSNRFRQPSTFLADLEKNGFRIQQPKCEYPQNFKQFSTPISRQLVEEYRRSVRESEHYFDDEEVQISKENAISHALELYESGELLDDAIAIMMDILSSDHTRADLYLCGKIMMKKQMYEEAIDMLTKTIDLDPMDPTPYLNRGECYVQLGLSDEAKIELDKYLKLEKPSNVQVLITLGKCRATTQDNEGALECFDEAIKIAEETEQPNAYAHFLRGDVYLQMGETEEATRDFQRVIEIDPDFAKPYEQTALEHEAQEEYFEAISVYQSLLKLYPLQSFYHLKTGLLSYYMGREHFEQAFSSLNKFHENMRENCRTQSLEVESEGYLIRGILFQQHVDLLEAIKNYSICVEMNFESSLPRALRHRAECYIQIQNLDLACHDYSSIVYTLGINYGPALRYLFRYPFIHEQIEPSGLDLQKSFSLLERALQSKGGISHKHLREPNFIKLLRLEELESQPKSRKGSRSSTRTVKSSKSTTVSVTTTPEPMEIPTNPLYLNLSPIEEEAVTTRDMVAFIIVSLFDTREREERRIKEQEALAANPKQKKSEPSKKQSTRILSLCELAIGSFNGKYSLMSGPDSAIIHSMRKKWYDYQVDFGRIAPEKLKKVTTKK